MDQKRASWRTSGAALAFASAAALIGTAGVAKADLFGIGNQASFGNGVIETLNLTTHKVVNKFIPDGAKIGSANGRGAQLFVESNLVYYTELTNGFGPTDFIRAAPWNNGLGGADLFHFANPVPGTGVVDLTGKDGFLYVMTGYPNGPEVVQKTDGLGNNIGAKVTLHRTSGATLSASDGFTILANGNWLINDGDLINSYRQYDSVTGKEIPNTLVQAHNNLGVCGSSTGVDYETKSGHLFFDCNLNNMVEDTVAGVFIANNLFDQGNFEDISIDAGKIDVPEPASLAILGSALIGFGLFRRRQRSA